MTGRPTRGGRLAPAPTQRARNVADARLCVIPLAVTGTLTAGDDAVDHAAFLIVAGLAVLYAVVVWLALRRQLPLPERSVNLADDVIALALLVVAEPSTSSAGRILVIAILVNWAFRFSQQRLLLCGVGLIAFLAVDEGVQHDVEAAIETALFAGVMLATCTLIALRVNERLVYAAAAERRAAGLQVEVRDLERRERSRLAQLLHDDALQRLLAARQDLDQGREGDAEAIDRAAEGFVAATQALRSLTFAAPDDALESAGLDATIRRIVEEAAARSGLAADVEVAAGLDGTLGTVVLPVVRELVTNVERHAGATRVRVVLDASDEEVVITVADDGRGIRRAEVADAERDGLLGLAGLRRRVAALGGTAEIAGVPGEGTQVTVTLPGTTIRNQGDAGEALRHEREWNAALVAGFPDPFVVTTEDLRIVDASDRFAELTGWSRAELLAAPPGVPPYAEPDAIQRIRADAAATSEPDSGYEAPGRLVCRDGRLVDVLRAVHNVRDPRGGRPLRLVTFKDLTATVLAQQRLRVERDVSTALRGVMREAYVQTRGDAVVEVNDRFLELSGYPRERVIGARRPYFFIAPSHHRASEALARAMDEEGAAEGTLAILRSDGVTVPTRVYGVSVRGPDGELLDRVMSAHPEAEPPPLGPPAAPPTGESGGQA